MGNESQDRGGGAGRPAPPAQRGEPMNGQQPQDPATGQTREAGLPGAHPAGEPGQPEPAAENPPAAPDPDPVPPARPARESRVEMTELVLPNDANPLGNILGGKVMHLMDIAGALAAARHSRRICVTASVDRIDFLHPIRVGEAILLEAQVTDAGRTSMEVRVNVYSENLRTGQRRHTATAFFTFVALDDSGRPAPVPAVIAETPDEQRLQAEARLRRQERLARAGRAGTGLPEAAGEGPAGTVPAGGTRPGPSAGGFPAGGTPSGGLPAGTAPRPDPAGGAIP
ncbi:acyl-CoA thioesterase [Thermaerobacter sp. PB12/4term]|nr:acyl-CoA thioesterase [Thermaerobacter sp. PB12/4term]